MTNQQSLNVYQRYVEAWKPIPTHSGRASSRKSLTKMSNIWSRVRRWHPVRRSKTWSAFRSSTLEPTSTSKTSPRITR